MSIETAAVSVPADDKLIEEKVNEEAPEIKERDSSPCKDDVPTVEKKELIAENSVSLGVSTTKVEETLEDNQSGIPIVVESQKVDDVPAEDGAKEVESSGPESEATSTKDIACETVDIQTVEDVRLEKPAVESVDYSPVEETTIEAAEKESQKVETVEVDEYKPVEKVAIEEVEKEVEKAETIEADESTPVEKVAIEEVEKEAEKEQTVEADENVLVETVASDVVDKEAETAQAIQDVITPVEKVATEEIEKEAEKAETIPTEQVETIATEVVEKELETTQAIEADCTKLDEKPDVEAVEKQIDDAKQEVEVTTDSAVLAVEEAQTTESKAEEVTLISDAEKPVENTESKAGVVDVVGGLLKEEGTLVCENAAEKEEKIVKTEERTEKNKKTEASIPNEVVLENGAEVTDRDLVDEAKEVLVKEDVYKDIKENEEIVVPSAIVEPPQEHKNSLLDVMALEKSSKPDGEANKLENAEESVKESKDEAKQEVVSVKSAQKQSGGGIISKVKQSIVKVKKAIIGKSPSSKVLTPEVKADEHVK